MIPKENVSDVISAVFDEAVDPRITVVGVGGAGGNPVGGAGGAAESAAAALRESLSSDIVFVVAGLGGAAGTGAGPVVAATAKGQGGAAVGIAMPPSTPPGRAGGGGGRGRPPRPARGARGGAAGHGPGGLGDPARRVRRDGLHRIPLISSPNQRLPVLNRQAPFFPGSKRLCRPPPSAARGGPWRRTRRRSSWRRGARSRRATSRSAWRAWSPGPAPR